MNFGGQIQWLENNSDTADGPSTPTSLGFSINDTANLNGTTYAANTGYSYASFLLGAVGSSSTTQQPFSIVGGRFRPVALYFQDDFKVTPKLTINAGLRWDYIPPYHETLDRWSFLNPDLTNPVTGNPGALQFAGNRGAGLSCQCRTPVNTYWKNFEPRVGFAYRSTTRPSSAAATASPTPTAAPPAARRGSGTGTGQTGFSTPISLHRQHRRPGLLPQQQPRLLRPEHQLRRPGLHPARHVAHHRRHPDPRHRLLRQRHRRLRAATAPASTTPIPTSAAAPRSSPSSTSACSARSPRT